ncbi:hypothetical protein ACIPSA_25655 [Streptomyces sp. NPDC086549]|uniref:hypothetical protein n=1 Tax=Streptomyces sp. NPDC086549 TaxID=3365752 RepID=UPI0038247A70
MTVRRIVVRIDRVVLDAATAGGRSAAEVAEALGAALRADLVAAAGTAAPDGEVSVGRLRVTAESDGVDAVARAASRAVARAMTDGGGGSGRTARSDGDGAPGRRVPSQTGGDGR